MLKGCIACDLNGGIGKKGSLPWHNKDDLSIFRKYIENATIIMGSSTWIDPKFPRKFPNNETIVLSSSPQKVLAKATPDKILQGEVIFGSGIIIGGAKVFNHYLDDIKELSLSLFGDVYDCDTKIDLGKIMATFNMVESQDYGPFKRFLLRKL